MPVLIITYDLNDPGQNYHDVLDFIKSYPWAKLSESSYAIETNKSPNTIFNRISKFLDKNDTLYVITLRVPWNGQGSKKVIDWLRKRLG